MNSDRGARSSARNSRRSRMPRALSRNMNWMRSSASGLPLDALSSEGVVIESAARKNRGVTRAGRFVGQIEAKRRDRHLLGGERLDVGAGPGLEPAALEHQPVIGNSAAVAALLDLHQFGVAPTLARDGDAGRFRRCAGGKIDV